MLDPSPQEMGGSDHHENDLKEADLRQKLSALQKGISPEQKRLIQNRTADVLANDPRKQVLRESEIGLRLETKRRLAHESLQKHEEAAGEFQTQSESAQMKAEDAQSAAANQKESLKKVENQNFAELENKSGDSDILPRPQKIYPDDVAVEIATAVDFSKIDKKVLAQAMQLFPHEPFDAEGLTSPDWA